MVHVGWDLIAAGETLKVRDDFLRSEPCQHLSVLGRRESWIGTDTAIGKSTTIVFGIGKPTIGGNLWRQSYCFNVVRIGELGNRNF